MTGKPPRKEGRIGEQPPHYRFFLNPYRDVRFTTCPQCGAKTRTRKLPLVIHVKPMQLAAMNTTCRYCVRCDLLIAHRDHVERSLTTLFGDSQPDLADMYLILGTLDRVHWLRGVRASLSTREALDWLHDFTEVVQFKPPDV
jgi:hypothetical protein